MGTIHAALDILRNHQPPINDIMIGEAVNFYLSGSPSFSNDSYIFPSTEAYPIGITVANGICSCQDDPGFEEDVPMCVHLVAVKLDAIMKEMETPKNEENIHRDEVAREPHSMTVTAIDGQGFEWLICVRSSSTLEDVDTMFAAARYAKEKITKYGWKPAHKYNRPTTPMGTPENKNTVTEVIPDVVSLPEPPIVQHTPQSPQTSQQSNTLTFAAESLETTVNNGKYYHKVKGGHFSKFGITVWQEVLEAVGLMNLDPMKTYSMKGWHAEYILKDGKPEKIVKLYKTTA